VGALSRLSKTEPKEREKNLRLSGYALLFFIGFMIAGLIVLLVKLT
jgi:hypothetical protein